MIWHQHDIDLGPPAGMARAAHEVFIRLRPALERQDGRLWFVRKLPGLRVRMQTGGAADEVLGSILAGLERDRVVAGVHAAVYEPEARRFGGEAAMELVHSFFHVDTLGFAAWYRQPPEARLGASVISLAIVSTLFDRLLGGAKSEIWDAWANLAAMHGLGHEPAGADPLPPITLDQLRPRASAEEAEALDRYARGVEALADGMGRLHREGSPTCVGPRAFAADVALFHWNRWGRPHAERVALLEGSLTALHPHRSLPFP